ncbi:hypothetical protein [Streptomyces sp. NPDC048340]|uniref:hypothetical protein n=1 Tax=Streptomyces sp. NPDC048340 TaxID=3365537 RepID=UPI00371134BE
MKQFPRYKLTPGMIDVDVPGWELEGDDVYGSHEDFVPDDFNRDVEAAMEWAEGIIGSRQEWRHVREDGFDRWEAGAAPVVEIPAVTTYGAAYRMNVQTDANGAVLVAYTKDAESGAVTRSQIRFDPSAVAYIRRRLAGA